MKYKGFEIEQQLISAQVWNDKIKHYENKKRIVWVGTRQSSLWQGFEVQMRGLVIEAPTMKRLKMAISSFTLQLNPVDRYWWGKADKWRFK